ncbi:A-kinase anchor protein 7 isoforms delta and gamma isoform X2 [Amia ocellicauda]|uniref:A-kinase anchor protein 7 isoforms delta and gamma isoform X2 n=1 Tax=Amia ocellicauda TaxID=2972642 RepID=UPI0034649BFC
MRNNNDADSSINLLKKQETKPKGNASKMLVKATCLGEKLKNRVGELSELPFYNIDDIADVFGIQHNGDQKPKCRRRRHRRRGKETCSEREKEMKPRIQRPNYFVAIPVTNKRILEKIGKIQNAMISKEKMLRSAVIPLEKMHLTVIVANLKNEDMIKRDYKATF